MKNHTQNVMGKLFPDSFLKNQNWAHLWVNILKFYTVYFYCMPSWRLSKYIKTRLEITYFYLINPFKKTKRGLGLLFLFYLLHDFWRKIYLLLHTCYTLVTLTGQISLSGCHYFIRCWAICWAIFDNQVWRHKFWN